jgi:hypothetical protein
LDPKRKSAEVTSGEGGFIPIQLSDKFPKLHIIFDNAGVFPHGEVSEGGFGVPDGVMGAEVDFEFVDKDFEVPHPMCGVGQIHKPWFEPTHHGTVQV